MVQGCKAHNGKGAENVHIVVILPVLNGSFGQTCDGSKYSMVDNNAIKLSVRKVSELYSSVCSLLDALIYTLPLINFSILQLQNAILGHHSHQALSYRRPRT